MLTGLPLKELKCWNNGFLTGNINSLRVLKDTLIKIDINNCHNVEGNFMVLADFPHLKQVDFHFTAVTGDSREIGERDFQNLEEIELPRGVYGGCGHQFQRISDAPHIINSLCSIKKQRPTLFNDWYGELSEDSPDWYEGDGFGYNAPPPFHIVFVQAGSRVGYRWESELANEDPCEVHWLDPEPERESSDYEKYIEELQEIEEQVANYREFYQPPTKEEYDRLWGNSKIDTVRKIVIAINWFRHVY